MQLLIKIDIFLELCRKSTKKGEAETLQKTVLNVA